MAPALHFVLLMPAPLAFFGFLPYAFIGEYIYWRNGRFLFRDGFLPVKVIQEFLDIIQSDGAGIKSILFNRNVPIVRTDIEPHDIAPLVYQRTAAETV